MSDLIRIAEATTLKDLADARAQGGKDGAEEADDAKAKPKANTEPKEIPDFRPGDTVVVHVRVREGSKERIQIFKGDVIQRRNRKFDTVTDLIFLDLDLVLFGD